MDLFVELDWAEAGLVIAGGVLVGRLAYDLLKLIFGGWFEVSKP